MRWVAEEISLHQSLEQLFLPKSGRLQSPINEEVGHLPSTEVAQARDEGSLEGISLKICAARESQGSRTPR